ncbi:hypothetical protein [Proteiniclasticum sediminis]|uniref:hypothetical protein n=1 Tax=Proteiniclasticum sediminis TaxID=2804028 RepID=UPI001BA5B450|nr:hypothetical protein [Proteiniclasticum sediminis]
MEQLRYNKEVKRFHFGFCASVCTEKGLHSLKRGGKLSGNTLVQDHDGKRLLTLLYTQEIYKVLGGKK